MPGRGKKHRLIVSKAQRGLMGAELARRRAGKKGRMEGMTIEKLRSDLKESAGKKLVSRVKRRKK